MLRLFIILTTGPGQILIEGHGHAVPIAGVSLLLTSTDQVRVGASGACYGFSSAELQAIYRDIRHLLPPVGLNMSMLHTVHTVAAEPALLSAMQSLAKMNPVAMLHFVLMYCLTVDGGVGTALLQQAISGDCDMFEFIYRHRLQAWAVQRYADALGVPVRKFNQIFKEKFGVSAKHWLLAQRLEHACRLLQTTPKKVIDVAFESGFSNHAHFSDSFRRHFQLSPSEVRRGQPVLPAAGRIPRTKRPRHES
ncbi:helix-turn-helix domain-containing protein [Paludibacterium purpuratum]|uniref:Helix-turn-helix protein n=1 Tax=Paludibacterium purpuratum TaxID=1144873 RepID=A0A4R7B341_9NEIS|nr:helix-turn-helix domain-containing protein [Paludibacterium purpuratum]TDR76584.1 helix-turn-helix protein [Paludibacterium purpuratum]